MNQGRSGKRYPHVDIPPHPPYDYYCRHILGRDPWCHRDNRMRTKKPVQVQDDEKEEDKDKDEDEE